VLENNINALRKQKRILIMSHLVLGYPSYDESRKMVREMVAAGADIIEMQFPFSEPSDGPVILKANHEALRNGAGTTKCFAFAEEMKKEFPGTVFVIMTYYNILFSYGIEKFVAKAKAVGAEGLIVPDLPPEESKEYVEACEKHGVDPVFLFVPTSSDERLRTVSQYSKGMIYSVGRKGVTGTKTQVDGELISLLKRYRRATNLPLALGFGIQTKADVDAIADYVDIAVIGSKLVSLQNQEGPEAVGRFLKGLR
jgi:tryptophan synthase alpha chain